MSTPPNVDPVELRKFSDIAHRWWDPEGAMGPLHRMNPLRVDWIDRHFPLAGKRALDVGCGGGILAEGLAGKGATVMGIDLAEKPLTVARLHALESGSTVDYRNADVDHLAASQPGSFDVVTCMEVLEHVPDPERTVAACAQLAAPGGWVFFSTINRGPKAFAFAIVGAEYVLGLLPRGTHEYAKFIRPSELAQWGRSAGLEMVELLGLIYNPITKRFTLGGDTGVNYIVAMRKAVAQ
jgi:2-polyprenyl-6-hydroxyphenyl methylase/3-demethylubiquinone-9 3-methyltransferase